MCFNPRPRVGGDETERIGQLRSWSFNPRPRVGGDQFCGFFSGHRQVSIHAPAWGATVVKERPFMRGDGFNPRPRVGGDLLLASSAACIACFNPRPRVGGDIAVSIAMAHHGGFNPRPRVGGDGAWRKSCQAHDLSCHICEPMTLPVQINGSRRREIGKLLSVESLSTARTSRQIRVRLWSALRGGSARRVTE